MTRPAAISGWARFCNTAGRRADWPAIVQGNEVVSFQALADLASAIAAGERCSQIEPGERVVVWSRNSPAMAAAILAVWSRNAVPVLLSAQTPARHVAHAVGVTEARLVVTEARNIASVRDVLRCDGLALDAGAFAAGRRRGDAHADVARSNDNQADEPASILFTSGSTGLPKGVTQSHRSLAAGCDAVGQALRLAADDRILCGVPWGFDYGWGQLLSTFFLGATQVLPIGAEAFAVCEAIGKHRPTVLASVPSLLAGLIRGVSGIEKTDLSSIRLLTNTGSKIQPELFREALSYFGHARISLNYGLTETYRTTTLDPALARSHPQSVGRAIPGVTVTIVDDDGLPVPSNEVGEVVHSGGGVFMGYWNNPEATAKVRRLSPLLHGAVNAQSGVYTGDLGHFDKDGLLYLVGRRDRQVKSMGVRVSPEEIETILLSSGLVRDAAVLSRPNDTLGEMVLAVVTPKGDRDPVPELKRYARREMSPFMEPRLYFVEEDLPRTSTGKVDYTELRRRYSGAGEVNRVPAVASD